MKQIAVLVCLMALMAEEIVKGDKRPIFRGRPSNFVRPGPSFQRQTDAEGAPESPEGAEPTTPSPAPGGSADGPYPPSGQPESGPYAPSGWKPKGQRLELPNRFQPRIPARQQQPTDSYGAPAPPSPSQQYGSPSATTPAPAPAEPTEPAAEPDQQSPNNRLRQQLRLQRLQLQRLRQQVQEQQILLLQQQEHLQQQRLPQQQQQQQVLSQGEYFVSLPDGRLQKVQFSTSPGSSAVFQQSLGAQTQAVSVSSTSSPPPSFVAHLEFMDVPHVDAPVYSYSAPLVRVA